MPSAAQDTKIKILPPEEAKKIAAGEVIDRPCALVREFMDNSLDASASEIDVSVDGGGIIRTEVSDNGSGMDLQDLELCCLAHATSKIRSVADLEKAVTLGFRGEALSAAAAVSHLEICTSRGGLNAWKLETGPGTAEARAVQSRRTKGTSVRASGLFDALPARRRFLKRESSEAAACLAVFKDKALVFPEHSFRFFQDGKLKAFYAPRESLKERFSEIALAGAEEKFCYEITVLGQGYKIVIVFGGPELSRTDRRQQYVFANRRRIQDYSLLQALEYGTRGWFPNNTHPVGAVYIDIDPALADFNIHPAKREVRFADIGAIHHSITKALENFRRRTYAGFADTATATAGENNKNSLFAQALEAETPAAKTMAAEKPAEQSFSYNKSAALPITQIAAEQNFSYEAGNAAESGNNAVIFLGRLFDLFILVKKNDRLYIIDQHAAHERILYDRFINKKIKRQELLVPIPFSAETEEDSAYLAGRQKDLADLGIVINRDQTGSGWHIEALPDGWKCPDAETVREILNLKNADKNLAEHWAAAFSCHSAIKDGTWLDDKTALALAEEAIGLEDPRCPHGRPIWAEIKKEDLLKAVKRT